MSGTMDIVIAAGVESMTRVPMGLSAALPAQNGFGTYMSPGIQEQYPNIQFSQFVGAEMVAKKYGLNRDQMDEFSFQSHQRAIAAAPAAQTALTSSPNNTHLIPFITSPLCPFCPIVPS